ncbi:MAG: FHA domain-containing protein [Nitrospirota bacterium]
MERVVYVEVLDKKGGVKERIRLDAFPATIGRAYTNNVIIDDKHVCPEHLRINLDEKGNFIIEDLGSVNGLYQIIPFKRVPLIEITPNLQISIGSTVLQFRRPEDKVAPAEIVKPDRTYLFPLLKHQGAALGIFFLSSLVLTLINYLNSYDKISSMSFVGGLLAIFFLFAIWAGVWSMVNRLLTHTFRFASHLSIASLGTISILFFIIITEYYSFIFSPELSLDIIMTAGLIILGSLFLFCHLSIIPAASQIRRLVYSTLISAGVVGIFTFIAYIEDSRFSNEIKFQSVLKPVKNRWLITSSSDSFFENTKQLKEKVDASAKEE